MQFAPYFPSRRHMAAKIYPGDSLHAVKKRLLFLGRSLLHGSAYRYTLALFSPPSLQPVLRRHARAVEKTFKPYLIAGLTPTERYTLLARHYWLLTQHWDQKALSVFLRHGVDLARFEGPKGEDVFIRLAYMPQFQREGEITLVLEADGQRFYSITFSLTQNPQGQKGLLVGCMQGPGRQSVLDEDYIRQFTHHFFGMRPKALMVELLGVVARHWQCGFIKAVSNQGHIFASQRYKRKNKLKTDYNGLWHECGGHAVDELTWLLPLALPRKEMSDIASKKRSQYRKRYQWLDETALCCQRSLTQFQNTLP
ncbi:VirK/YbjX family protein [Gallaecimonas mangrovi]|uniref:VirK/YbjX family protein n=1 Tax=Gallaecimonas mangrovi TaxID=2291597 RepID=UPI000E1FFB6F|nr:VirK/YbjX family protein [Gallaecimonas mangrovi]